MKGQRFARRLGFALNGLRLALLRERSFRTQAAVAALVLAVLAAARPPAVWWALAALAVGFVLATELVNTALETLADRLHPEQHPEIQAAKDVAAAAVLAASLTALAVGLAFLLR